MTKQHCPCGETTKSKTGICQRCRPKKAPEYRPDARCTTCDRQAGSEGGQCRACIELDKATAKIPLVVDDPNYALRGGRWVPVAGVLRWVSLDDLTREKVRAV